MGGGLPMTLLLLSGVPVARVSLPVLHISYAFWSIFLCIPGQQPDLLTLA